MAIVSSGALIDELRRYPLLTADQLAELPHLAQSRLGQARALAKLLGQRGWLTIYQINQLLAGNGKDLVIGPYQVLDRLGQGGLSQVFKARHAQHGWVVALKLLRSEALANDAGRQQFLHEMEAMARLDHPNIVQFCDLDQAGDTFYFAMEYVDGTDLGKHVALSGPMPVTDACDTIRQAALGLQHAHEHNLVHRDIKPVNLFLTHVPLATSRNRKGPVKMEPLIKILDWGLAGLRNPGETADAARSSGKGVVGTADYLAPEQARDHQAVDIRGDIYSLGCSLYFLLTGQAPFPSGSLMQKILQHQQAEPEPVSSFREDVPDDLVVILKRMMAKDPAARFQTPAAVALALVSFARRDPEPSGGTRKAAAVKAAVNPIKDDTPLPIRLGGGGRPRKGNARRSEGSGADTRWS